MDKKSITPASVQPPAGSSGGRRPYVAPELKLYGSLESLTRGRGKSAKGNEAAGGSGSSFATVVVSDRSVKQHIVRIGTHPIGVGLYLFEYCAEFQLLCGAGRQFGVMADEVERVMPEAVCRHPAGFQMVDYGMLGIRQPGGWKH